jgi:tRNA-splicing ligase RtcB
MEQDDAPEHFVIKENGKEAVGFINKMKLDNETMKQLRLMLQHETVEHVRIMPDAHRGAGNCVGFTSHLMDKILPRFIGGDIGCGILTYNFGQHENLDLVELDRLIKNRIPMGSGKRNIWQQSIITDEDINWVCHESYEQANNFSQKYYEHFQVCLDDYIPEYSNNLFEKKCSQIKVSFNDVLCSIGSLGGGNHFIECNKDSKNNLYITIHSGSRTFGYHIYEYHQEKIDKTRHFDYKEFQEFMKDIRQKKIKVPKILKQYEDDYMANFEAQKHTDYLENEEAYEYFFDMIFSQNIAKLNRRVMLREILRLMNLELNTSNIIESIHNYISFDDMIMRKGAISAHNGQICVIALNMRDGLLLCRGKGNEEWNNSTAHGAGRVIVRGQAASRIYMKEYQETMKDVYSTSVSLDTIDESPQCYKDSEMIIKLIEPSVEIIDILRPILNIKAQ